MQELNEVIGIKLLTSVFLEISKGGNARFSPLRTPMDLMTGCFETVKIPGIRAFFKVISVHKF